MSTRMVEDTRRLRWMLIAVALCAGALALMTVGCTKTPGSPGVAPLAMANRPCAASPKTHLYVVSCDENGEPLWVAPKDQLKVRKGESVLFVNPSARRVMVKAEAEFQVFTEGNEVTLEPRESTCRTISQKAPVKKGIHLNATYEAPAPPPQQVAATAAPGAAAPTPAPPMKKPPSGIIKPLGGPGMDIDG
jgi:hypothetical protein